MLVHQTLEMRLAEERPVLAKITSTLHDGHFAIFNYPASFAQQRARIDWACDRVQYGAVCQAEVAGYIAPLFFTVDDPERPHLLERGDEAAVQIIADFFVGQCVHTERFGVVSGKPGLFKVSGDVKREEELAFLCRLPGGLRWAWGERDLRTVVFENDFAIGQALFA